MMECGLRSGLDVSRRKGNTARDSEVAWKVGTGLVENADGFGKVTAHRTDENGSVC